MNAAENPAEENSTETSPESSSESLPEMASESQSPAGSEAPSAELSASAAAAGEAAPQQLHEPAPAQADSNSATPAVTPASAPTSESEPRKPGELRIKIGSMGDPEVAREVRARPNVAVPITNIPGGEEGEGGSPAPAPKPPKSYPPVKLSRQLSPELEVELAEALGGMSLEDVLAGKTPAAANKTLEAEARVMAKVVSIHRDDVFFDLGGQNQGVASLRQFPEPPAPGTALEMIIVRQQPEEGLYELTLPGAAIEVGNWGEIEEGIVVQATITGHNKGGLECTVSNLRGFMPVSQIALYRVEDLEGFVGQSMACLVTEANPERRNLVLSRRAVLEREQEETKRKIMEEIAVGQSREGVVRSLMAFGAFVDLGSGVDGLIHISQMSWDRVNHPSDVLQVGQKVKVRIEKFDRETGKIGLSYREQAENPWNNITSKYPVGSRHEGKVSKIMQFGAFVRLEAGVEGLIHISEISYQRVHRVADVLKEGQEVEVQVMSVDVDNQRIGLSLKAMEAKPTPVDKEKQRVEQIMDELEAAPGLKKKATGPLKGGRDKPSGGEKFGLNW